MSLLFSEKLTEMEKRMNIISNFYLAFILKGNKIFFKTELREEFQDFLLLFLNTIRT